MLGVKLDGLVVLPQPVERVAQVAERVALPSPVPKLTRNSETLGVELDGLVVLTQAVEHDAQVAYRAAFPSPVPNLTENDQTLGE